MYDEKSQDKFAKHVGIDVVSCGDGHAEVRMKLAEKHLNALGWVHGGVIFTIADYAFALASNSGDKTAVSLSANITFMKSPKGDDLFARARRLSASNRTATYEVVISDCEGQIALFTGTAYCRKKP